MSATGGSLESITLNGQEFPVDAEAEAQRKIGGFENEYKANGNGTGRLIKTRVGLSYAGLVIEIDDARLDQEFLQDLADGNDFFDLAVTHADGSVYQGTGQIVDGVEMNTKEASATLSLMGPGRLTRQ